MMDEAQAKVIGDNPIGEGLDAFRASFRVTCESNDISSTPDSINDLGQEDLQNLSISLLSALQILKASRLLPPRGRGKSLFINILELSSSVSSDDFDFDRIIPLLKVAVDDGSPDTLIWLRVYDAVVEPTPPPRPVASPSQQTPWVHNTSSFANPSEYRQYVDKILKLELGQLYVGVPGFHEAYFGRVAGLGIASEAVFEKCTAGDSPLFNQGWTGWPHDANQDDVLSWFAGLSKALSAFAEESITYPPHTRRPLAQPNKPIQGSTAERKLDVGFVSDPEAGKDSRCHWAQILVPGELKSKPSADVASKAWLDLGTYAREVLAAQDTRRYVLGFTLCGSLMRIWAFDRLGGVASEQFDINKDGLRFVFIILGFLWMNDEELGFDTTIKTTDGQRFIEIERNGSTERIIIETCTHRARCIAGRATTCWKAYRQGQPQTPLVVKDSWQYTERDDEGELLSEATGQGVAHVARYYHHETVFVGNVVDDVCGNVRRNLDVTRALKYRPERSETSPGSSVKGPLRQSRSSNAGLKRPFSQIDAPLPPSKRGWPVSPTKPASNAIPNRVHRRVIVRDYGKPIYKASSRPALLSALEGCIEGHKSLREAGFLHRDISINNLMINEDDSNPSWSSFLIDLDLAIREPREQSSGAKGKTGTRAFMAIGALLGEQHSYMHDLESFFWVLLWICIHYNGPGVKSRVVPRFDKWNYLDTEDLASVKTGIIADEDDFQKMAEQNFAMYFQSLRPWINRLRKVVFPDGRRWKKPNPELYGSMQDLLRQAKEDAQVIGHDG
ncbi:hypothetical protein V8C35DRAFT_291397 [Trichoderma chlorosporum]